MKINLVQWLKKNGIPMAEFAKKIRIAENHLYRISNELVYPSLATSAKIYLLTKGEVATKYSKMVFKHPRMRAKIAHEWMNNNDIEKLEES